MQPLVVIIIVNYNGFEDTIECVTSLSEISYKNYEILVVDNGSSICPTAQQLEYLQTNTTYIVSDTNLGFSGGNNIGIQKAKEMNAQYVLLLNNDTTVKSDFLDILVRGSALNEGCGIVGGKINFYKQSDVIWFGGGKFNEKTGEGNHQRWNCKDKGNTGEITKVTFLTGCLMLIPMHVIENVGMLEEKYFLYAEDTEYCCRVMKAGYHLFFCEDAVIYHKVSATTGERSEMSQYYMARNTLYIAEEYCKRPFLCYITNFLHWFKEIIRGRMKLYPNLMGVYDFLRGKTGQWKK